MSKDFLKTQIKLVSLNVHGRGEGVDFSSSKLTQFPRIGLYQRYSTRIFGKTGKLIGAFLREVIQIFVIEERPILTKRNYSGKVCTFYKLIYEVKFWETIRKLYRIRQITSKAKTNFKGQEWQIAYHPGCRKQIYARCEHYVENVR